MNIYLFAQLLIAVCAASAASWAFLAITAWISSTILDYLADL